MFVSVPELLQAATPQQACERLRAAGGAANATAGGVQSASSSNSSSSSSSSSGSGTLARVSAYSHPMDGSCPLTGAVLGRLWCRLPPCATVCQPRLPPLLFALSSGLFAISSQQPALLDFSQPALYFHLIPSSQHRPCPALPHSAQVPGLHGTAGAPAVPLLMPRRHAGAEQGGAGVLHAARPRGGAAAGYSVHSGGAAHDAAAAQRPAQTEAAKKKKEESWLAALASSIKHALVAWLLASHFSACTAI